MPVSSLKPNAIVKPEIVRDLPISSEGLVIVDGTAYVLIDGDAGNSNLKCKTEAKFIQFPI